MTQVDALIKERLVLRKADPAAYTALSLLVDTAQKAAKKENRPTEDTDISRAAAKLTKEAVKDIELFGEASQEAEKLRSEIALYKRFLPKTLSREEIKELAQQAIGSHCSINNKQLRGHVMRSLKDTAGMDMQVLVAVLDELLSKNN